MDDIGKSTLLFKQGRLIGFTFLKHPIRRNRQLHLVFYHIESENQFVLCLSEVRGKGNPGLMRPYLGTFGPR